VIYRLDRQFYHAKGSSQQDIEGERKKQKRHQKGENPRGGEEKKESKGMNRRKLLSDGRRKCPITKGRTGTDDSPNNAAGKKNFEGVQRLLQGQKNDPLNRKPDR